MTPEYKAKLEEVIKVFSGSMAGKGLKGISDWHYAKDMLLDLAQSVLSGDFIKKHYDEFLRYYYNAPCSGCKEGHSSFWKTVTESDEWKAWVATNPKYDISECEELGIIGKQHFKDFIEFVKQAPITERV